jgi:5-methylcytosine-specific restriction endonuclease McrBC regulatory subunit McrC
MNVSARSRADDITCGEWGMPAPERWSEPTQLSDTDRAAIAALEARRVMETQPAGELLRIAGTDQVGLIVLPSGRSIGIQPKISGLVLLDWLAYVGDCPPVSRLTREGALREGGPHQLLAGLFLDELELVTRRHMGKDYTPERSDATTLRGRVLVRAMVQGYHRLPSVPQARRARTLDTPHNRLLAATLDLVASLLPDDADERRRFAALRDDWAVVPRGPVDLLTPTPDLRHACPPGYATAVQLAGMILRGFTRHPRAGSCGEAFLISMSGVWERALRRMCRELRPLTAWAPVRDALRTRPWHDEQARWMTADVLLESPAGGRWVLDAKYKRGYGDEDRDDRFQACAYAVAFEAGKGALVYPTAEGRAGRSRLLLSGYVGERPVTIESVELPLGAGPEACREAFCGILGGRAASRLAEEPHR